MVRAMRDERDEQWGEVYQAPSEQPAAATSDVLGWILLALPLAGSAGAFAPARAASIGAMLVVFASAGLVSVDAARWKIWPFTRWVVGMLVIWPVFFPLYFFERQKKGAPPRLLFAISVLAIFLGALTLPSVLG